MAQVNVTTDPNVSTQRPMATAPVETYDSGEGARTAATSNLTWALAVVLIIAAIAVALVFVFHNVHP